ncbi:MAG: IPT/TIG domain-containing protein [Acidobacteriota bacterium]
MAKAFLIAACRSHSHSIERQREAFAAIPQVRAGARTSAFVARLGSKGSLIWHAFLGGVGVDIGGGLCVDGSGSVYVTGTSDSSWGAPTRAFTGGYDAMAAKLDSSGSLIWPTFLGGYEDDMSYGTAGGADGSVHVTGTSESRWDGSAIPPPADYNAFVAKLVETQSGPTITKIKSKRPTAGSTATIIGAGFSSNKTANAVYFGNLKAEVKRARTRSSTGSRATRCRSR